MAILPVNVVENPFGPLRLRLVLVYRIRYVWEEVQGTLVAESVIRSFLCVDLGVHEADDRIEELQLKWPISNAVQGEDGTRCEKRSGHLWVLLVEQIDSGGNDACADVNGI